MIEQLQQDIHTWSKANFGNQISKHLGVELNYINPAFGIIEELGELAQAIADNDDEEIEDAIADTCVYTCDFTARFPLQLTKSMFEIQSWQFKHHETNSIIQSCAILSGDFAHHILKTQQGIRGYENLDTARVQLSNCISRILCLLVRTSEYFKLPHPIKLTQETFDKIVSKRDWKKNPQTGA